MVDLLWNRKESRKRSIWKVVKYWKIFLSALLIASVDCCQVEEELYERGERNSVEILWW